LLIVVLTTSCAVTPIEPDPQLIRQAVDAGTRIRVVTTTGETARFRVEEIADAYRAGGGERVRYEDISAIGV
jgi:hypothetical protein